MVMIGKDIKIFLQSLFMVTTAMGNISYEMYLKSTRNQYFVHLRSKFEKQRKLSRFSRVKNFKDMIIYLSKFKLSILQDSVIPLLKMIFPFMFVLSLTATKAKQKANTITQI